MLCASLYTMLVAKGGFSFSRSTENGPALSKIVSRTAAAFTGEVPAQAERPCAPCVPPRLCTHANKEMMRPCLICHLFGSEESV